MVPNLTIICGSLSFYLSCSCFLDKDERYWIWSCQHFKDVWKWETVYSLLFSVKCSMLLKGKTEDAFKLITNIRNEWGCSYDIPPF